MNPFSGYRRPKAEMKSRGFDIKHSADEAAEEFDVESGRTGSKTDASGFLRGWAVVHRVPTARFSEFMREAQRVIRFGVALRESAYKCTAPAAPIPYLTPPIPQCRARAAKHRMVRKQRRIGGKTGKEKRS
jgi:hypothetical protein